MKGWHASGPFFNTLLRHVVHVPPLGHGPPPYFALPEYGALHHVLHHCHDEARQPVPLVEPAGAVHPHGDPTTESGGRKDNTSTNALTTSSSSDGIDRREVRSDRMRTQRAEQRAADGLGGHTGEGNSGTPR